MNTHFHLKQIQQTLSRTQVGKVRFTDSAIFAVITMKKKR